MRKIFFILFLILPILLYSSRLGFILDTFPDETDILDNQYIMETEYHDTCYNDLAIIDIQPERTNIDQSDTINFSVLISNNSSIDEENAILYSSYYNIAAGTFCLITNRITLLKSGTVKRIDIPIYVILPEHDNYYVRLTSVFIGNSKSDNDLHNNNIRKRFEIKKTAKNTIKILHDNKIVHPYIS